VTPGRCLAALWLVWAALWALFALRTNATVSQQPRSERLKHGLPTAFGAYLLAGVRVHVALLKTVVISRGGALVWPCVALTALGIAHAVWARVHLGKLWSGIVTLKAEHKIVRTGPYALTRHPIYTGLLLALAATACARGTLAGLAGFAIIAAGFKLKIRQEETLLAAHFGDAYRAYQREVPALIPGL